MKIITMFTTVSRVRLINKTFKTKLLSFSFSLAQDRYGHNDAPKTTKNN